MTNFTNRVTLAMASGVCVALVPGVVFAAGFHLPGHGIQPLGRAGATVASGGQNLNSLWHNPANLAGMESLKLTVDMALINLDFEFSRAPRTMPNGEIRRYGTVENDSPLKADPQILIGGPTGVENLSWAFGAYAPYLSGHRFPEKGPQRYTLVDNDASILGYFHLAAGYQVGEKFRVGAGIQWVPAQFNFLTMTSGYTGLYGDPEDEDLDILSEVTLTSILNFSGNMGVWWQIAPSIEFGAAVQAPVFFQDDDAKMRTRLPSSPAFNNAELSNDSVSSKMNFPWMARAGIRWVGQNLDVEVAATYERWSSFEEIGATPNEVSVTGVPGIGSIPVGPLSIQQDWEDTFALHFGGDYRINAAWTVRAGYAFEFGAIPDERYSVFLADGDKHLIAGGATWDFGGWSLDAGFGAYLMPDRNIANSKVRQINPTDAEGELTLVVGNGGYSQTYMAGGMGVNVLF